jgi:hypothetical protein
MARIRLLLESTILEMALACVECVCVKVQIRRISNKKVVQLQRETVVVGARIRVIISVIIIEDRAVRQVNGHNAAAVIGINSRVIRPGKTI